MNDNCSRGSVEQWVERQAQNLRVVGLNPVEMGCFFSYCQFDKKKKNSCFVPVRNRSQQNIAWVKDFGGSGNCATL